MRKQLFDTICAEIAEGATIRDVCRKHKIGRSGLYEYLETGDDATKEQYARAQYIRCENMADDLLNIADRHSGDVRRDQLRVDSRKWLLSKLVPKKYGDKLTMDANISGTTKIIRLPAKAAEGDPV